MKPDPDFEDFARDCIRLAGQEKSRELRSRLLVLAREWMHAAMQEPRCKSRQERDHRARAVDLGELGACGNDPGAPITAISS